MKVTARWGVDSLGDSFKSDLENHTPDGARRAQLRRGDRPGKVLTEVESALLPSTASPPTCWKLPKPLRRKNCGKTPRLPTSRPQASW